MNIIYTLPAVFKLHTNLHSTDVSKILLNLISFVILFSLYILLFTPVCLAEGATNLPVLIGFTFD